MRASHLDPATSTRAEGAHAPATVVAVGSGAAAIALLLGSRSGPDLRTHVGYLALGLVLAVVASVATIVARDRRLVGLVALAALALVAARTDVPMAVRWHASRASFERAVEAGGADPGWIGAYRVATVDVRDGHAIFTLARPLLLDPLPPSDHATPRGFVHAPGAASLVEVRRELRYDGLGDVRSLGDGWYAFETASITGH